MTTVLQGKNVAITALPPAIPPVVATNGSSLSSLSGTASSANGFAFTGFPSPAEQESENILDLNQYLIAHPAATFFIRVRGSSMSDAGIKDGDILIVDRAAKPISGSVVVAVLNGEFTIRYFFKRGDRYLLMSATGKETPIGESDDFEVWGVATYVIHAFKRE